MATTSYTAPLAEDQVKTLRDCLERDGFEFSEKPYAIYSGKKGKLNVTVYEKGPKVLVQGKETGDFVRFTLEPEVLGEARLGYEEVWNAEMFEPHFGVDESGKGDFFGPLVIAGVYTDSGITRRLLDAGIMDSKRVGSAKRIKELSNLIRKEVGGGLKVVRWSPEKYNELHKRYRNVNRMLALGHARVIQDLSRRFASCGRVICDQFSKSKMISKELVNHSVSIELEERVRAESDIAVAAASILARESFLEWMEKVSERSGIQVPLGAGESSIETAREFMERFGEERMEELVKRHFRNFEQIK